MGDTTLFKFDVLLQPRSQGLSSSRDASIGFSQLLKIFTLVIHPANFLKKAISYEKPVSLRQLTSVSCVVLRCRFSAGKQGAWGVVGRMQNAAAVHLSHNATRTTI